jgi:hypothetical protein
MRLKYHGIHEAIARDGLVVQHVATGDMLADALTKAFNGSKMKEFVHAIGLAE